MTVLLRGIAVIRDGNPHERRARGALPASHPGARSVPPAAHQGIHAMARYLTLAVCQTGPIQRRATRPETVERLVHLLERAAAAGADLAVFPEMALTTFFPRWSLEEGEIDAFYETEMPGPRDPAAVRCGAPAPDRLRARLPRSSASPTAASGASTPWCWSARDGGVIGQNRKMHIPGSEAPEEGTTVHLERRYFEPGDLGFPVFGFDGVRVGMTLCNDRRWPETYRMLCLKRAPTSC